MKPVVSIILVTFNNEGEIAACLHALSQQSDIQRCEIILIDNHSRDNTISTVRSFRTFFGDLGVPFTLIRNSYNLFFTLAVNQGLEKAHGKFVLLLNPDTEIRKNALQLLVQYLSNHPDVGAVAPQLVNPDGSIQPSCRRFPRYRYVWFEALGLSRLFPRSRFFNGWKMGDFDHQHAAMVDQPQGACLLVRGELLRQFGGLDSRFRMFFSDVDLCRQIVETGMKVAFFPEAKVVHKLGRSVYQSRAAMIWQSHLDFANYFLKWYRSPFQRVCNLLGLPFLFLIGIGRWCGARLFDLVKK